MDLVMPVAIEKPIPKPVEIFPVKQRSSSPGFWEKLFVPIWVMVHIAWLAIKVYGSLGKVRKLFRSFEHYNKNVYGKSGKRKFAVKNRKYWLSQYMPPFPSSNFDRFMITEMDRYIPHLKPVNAFQQVNLAVTTKCPLRCEHCLEWENLNLKETFSYWDLKEIVSGLQKNGLGHVSLTGGEPINRVKDVLELIKEGGNKTEWWILTSGFGLDLEKAKKLKEAGAAGIVISLDHYLPDRHNKFRGNSSAFQHAMRAIHASDEAGLVTSVSLCFTKETANDEFITEYVKLMEDLPVDFVQWLEPKQEGNYKGKDVLLSEDQISLIESWYEKLGHEKEFSNFPQIIYHGYYQRRIGCQSGGKMSFYIDSLGFVNSCPFCHTHDFHVSDLISNPELKAKKMTECPLY